MDVAFLLFAIIGFITGILVGLIPALPIYFGPFLLYGFVDFLSPTEIIVFWISILISSQVFSSISSIGFRIPGEESTLVYINDVYKLTEKQREELLYLTAKGSLIASLTSILLLYFLYNKFSTFHYYGSLTTDIILYTIIIFLFFVTNYKRPIASLLLILLGLFLSPKNNYFIPQWWFHIQQIFSQTTLFMMILGLFVIPNIFSYTKEKLQNSEESVVTRINKRQGHLLSMIKGTLVGIFLGLIPGPAASFGSIGGYYANIKKSSYDRIISAESGNNSAVLMPLLMFFLLGIPLTGSSLIISNLLDIKGLDITEIVNVNFFQTIILIMIIFSFLNYIFAIRMIPLYFKIVSFLHKRTNLFVILIVVALIILDITVSEIQTQIYLLLLFVFTVFGLLLKKHNINPIPFVFMVLFGDKIVWTYIQNYLINLSN